MIYYEIINYLKPSLKESIMTDINGFNQSDWNKTIIEDNKVEDSTTAAQHEENLRREQEIWQEKIKKEKLDQTECESLLTLAAKTRNISESIFNDIVLHKVERTFRNSFARMAASDEGASADKINIMLSTAVTSLMVKIFGSEDAALDYFRLVALSLMTD